MAVHQFDRPSYSGAFRRLAIVVLTDTPGKIHGYSRVKGTVAQLKNVKIPWGHGELIAEYVVGGKGVATSMLIMINVFFITDL